MLSDPYTFLHNKWEISAADESGSLLSLQMPWATLVASQDSSCSGVVVITIKLSRRKFKVVELEGFISKNPETGLIPALDCQSPLMAFPICPNLVTGSPLMASQLWPLIRSLKAAYVTFWLGRRRIKLWRGKKEMTSLCWSAGTKEFQSPERKMTPSVSSLCSDDINLSLAFSHLVSNYLKLIYQENFK